MTKIKILWTGRKFNEMCEWLEARNIPINFEGIDHTDVDKIRATTSTRNLQCDTFLFDNLNEALLFKITFGEGRVQSR